jgi:hypothetical protein
LARNADAVALSREVGDTWGTTWAFDLLAARRGLENNSVNLDDGIVEQYGGIVPQHDRVSPTGRSPGEVGGLVQLRYGIINGVVGPAASRTCSRCMRSEQAFRNGCGGPHPDRGAAPRRALHQAVPQGSG